MHLKTRNVNTAFKTLVEMFYYWNDKPQDAGCTNVVKRPSRNGNVLMIDEPVTITYTHPRERVLFNQARDANPFGHLYEALWMLAGRNDVAPLAYYMKQFKEYSDDGKTLNGAYGYRWRKTRNIKISMFGNYAADAVRTLWEGTPIDQLDMLVNHLKADPNSRRAVLQMWNVEDDLLKIGNGKCDTCCGIGQVRYLTKGEAWHSPTDPCPRCNGTGKDLGSKDVCCNLSVMFSIRVEPDGNWSGTGPGALLDMTVTNRSNDMIWGMLGANYVHFTILQEYMAARLGVEVGKYHHFTNNLHVYDWNWKPEEWLVEGEQWSGQVSDNAGYAHTMKTIPLVSNPEVFEKELPRFVECNTGPEECSIKEIWEEPFLIDVAQPMCRAFYWHKHKDYDMALRWANKIKADDWRIAATSWLERRLNKKEVVK